MSPCLFNFYAEYIMRKARLDEAQLESRLLGEISITSDMQMTPPLWEKLMDDKALPYLLRPRPSQARPHSPLSSRTGSPRAAIFSLGLQTHRK